MITPISPIKKINLKKQPNPKYSPKKKSRSSFENILDKEISNTLGCKISIKI